MSSLLNLRPNQFKARDEAHDAVKIAGNLSQRWHYSLDMEHGYLVRIINDARDWRKWMEAQWA